MKKLASTMLVVLGLVLAVAAPSQAREGEQRGQWSRWGDHGGRRDFDGRRGLEERREFHRWGGPRVFIGVAPSLAWGPVYTYGGYAAPVYSYAPPPTYWYYCRSYGAYYPNVPSCPEPWVPVPAAP